MKLISAKNISVVLTLVFIVFLSQSNALQFLLNTYLGRLIFLSIIVFVTANNNKLGLVIVLATIVFFNYNMTEGFQNASKESLSSIAENKKADGINPKEATAVEEDKVEKKPVAKANSKAVEGFCMSDRELSLLRGKRPNSIPVLSNMRSQPDGILPHEMNDFSINPSTIEDDYDA